MTNKMPIKYKEISGTDFINKHNLSNQKVEGFFNDSGIHEALHKERVDGWEFVQLLITSHAKSLIFREIKTEG